MRFSIFYILTILFIVGMFGVGLVEAGFFDINPTPTEAPSQDTWTAVDKVWVFQPDVATNDGYKIRDGGIRFFVTYKNQNDHFEIRNVDADTWYRANINGYFRSMYYQGGE